jgi:hypothetical protein
MSCLNACGTQRTWKSSDEKLPSKHEALSSNSSGGRRKREREGKEGRKEEGKKERKEENKMTKGRKS